MSTKQAGPRQDRPAPLTSPIMPRSGMRALRRRSVIAQLPLWETAPPERRRLIAESVDEAARTAHHNRTAVLGHADLAEQLTRRLGYTHAQQWTGYVPPRFFECGGARERWAPNDSPVRGVLVELLAEAASRAAPS